MENIVIQRGRISLLEDLPPYSIAVDGFVQGPQIDLDNHRFSFDHHSGCLRYCTTSACHQAWVSIQTGLEDLDRYTIYANDVDIDVCAAIWCLKNPDRCKEPLVIKLINAVNIADMFAGSISMNGMTKIVEWVCSPETDSKRYNDYSKISDDGLKSILEAVMYRIDQYVDGESSLEISRQSKHGEYKILRNQNNWVLVESDDPHVYGGLYQAGFNRIVKIYKQSDGSLAVSLAKKSDFIDNFPLEKFYQEFNKLEPGWGGGSSCGGSVRAPDGSRSRLPLDTIVETIDRVILAK